MDGRSAVLAIRHERTFSEHWAPSGGLLRRWHRGIRRSHGRAARPGQKPGHTRDTALTPPPYKDRRTPTARWVTYSSAANETKNEPERREASLRGRDAQVTTEPPIGIEPMTYSLRVRLAMSTAIQACSLTCCWTARSSRSVHSSPEPLLARALASEARPVRSWRAMTSDRQTQPEQDAFLAWTYATNAVLRADQVAGSVLPPTPADVFESYARDVRNELGADPARLYAAARQACLEAAKTVDTPGRWRVGLCAVELCRRAAVMPDQSPGDEAAGPSVLAVWPTSSGARVVLVATDLDGPYSAEWRCEGCQETSGHVSRDEAEEEAQQHSLNCVA